MRRPVQIQLLLPTLSVVVLAIVLASGASAYVGAVRARQAQEDSLSRVVATLSEAKFPLSEPVLRQMSGLSGAEFIFVDRQHRVRAATLPPAANELRRLEQWPSDPLPAGAAFGLWATRPGIELGGRMYLIRRVPISGRGPDPVPGSLVVLYSEALLVGAPCGRPPTRPCWPGLLRSWRWSCSVPCWPSGSCDPSAACARRRRPSPAASSRPSPWAPATTSSATWPWPSTA